MQKLFLLGALTFLSLHMVGTPSQTSDTFSNHPSLNTHNTSAPAADEDEVRAFLKRHNTEKYRPRALSSVIEQTSSDFLATPLTKDTLEEHSRKARKKDLHRAKSVVQDYVDGLCNEEGDMSSPEPSGSPIWDEKEIPANPATLLAPYFEKTQQELKNTENNKRLSTASNQEEARNKILHAHMLAIARIEKIAKIKDNSSNVESFRSKPHNNATAPKKLVLSKQDLKLRKKIQDARKKIVEWALRNGFIDHKTQTLMRCPVTGNQFHRDPENPDIFLDYLPLQIEWISEE